MKNADKIKELSDEVEVVKREIIEVLAKNYPGCMIDVRLKVDHIGGLVKHQEEILLGTDLDAEYEPNLLEPKALELHVGLEIRQEADGKWNVWDWHDNGAVFKESFDTREQLIEWIKNDETIVTIK